MLAQMTTPDIRNARLDDLDRLAPLFDAYRCFYGQPTDLDGARAFLAERLAHGESWVLLAEQGAQLLGFVQLYPLFSSVRMARTWLLNDLFVLPMARRRGVARALLEAAAAAARAQGSRGLSLATAHDNAPAQALYTALGWQRDRQFLHFELPL